MMIMGGLKVVYDGDKKIQRVVQSMWSRVNELKAAFEARWMWLSLQRVDAELYQAMQEQLDIFDQETITGTAEDVAEHGEACLRGFAKVMQTMESAKVADTAYVIGHDRETGLTVAVGNHKGSAKRVKELHPDVIFVSGDEVAALMAAKDRVTEFVMATKRIWPGSELMPPKYSEEGS